MKKIMLMAFTALMLCSKQNVNAQITLEHTYDSAGYNLSMVNLEIEGYKYLFKDIWWQRRLVLYNLDHSIFKIMYYPFTTGYSPGAHLYISEHLFNTDDKIEYLFAFNAVGPPALWHTMVMNELGDTLFSVDSLTPLIAPTIPQEQQPIYNTPDGTKMILTNPYNYQAKVYSLAGTLTNSIEPIGLSSDDLAQLKTFPNPNDGNATIEFRLPQGIDSGEIVLYNVDGTEIKRYKVDSRFGNLILNQGVLSSGTYMYQLMAGNKTIDAKKMIIIR